MDITQHTPDGVPFYECVLDIDDEALYIRFTMREDKSSALTFYADLEFTHEIEVPSGFVLMDDSGLQQIAREISGEYVLCSHQQYVLVFNGAPAALFTDFSQGERLMMHRAFILKLDE